jgi:hypothetical protein
MLLQISVHYHFAFFIFTTASRTAQGPTQPAIQWVPGALSLGVKRPGREADHLPPSHAEVKAYLHSRNTLSWRGAQLKKESTGTILPLPLSLHLRKRHYDSPKRLTEIGNLQKHQRVDSVDDNFRGCIQKFPDLVDNEINNNNKHSLRSNTKGYSGKVTRLTHKTAIQLHLVAESCTICSSRSRRPVRKLLDTPS